MARVVDRRVWLTGGARNQFLNERVAALSDGIFVAEGRENGLLPFHEDGPRRAVGGRGGIARRRRDEQRKLPRAGLVRIVGERRVVASNDVVGWSLRAAATDDQTHGEHR